ncbi:MAG: hypothetical protein PHR87_02010 [Sulfurospirillaceae bacterium]|nr:hypothetical protein [Sulfurospirillaceae bacterium]
MKQSFFGCVILLVFFGCSAKVEHMRVEPIRVEQLRQELLSLGDNIDTREAKMLAYEAILYPQELAVKYGLVYPPTFHNFLINAGLKERGLCYEWSEDMITHLKAQHYQSFDLRWGVANKGAFDEHNSVVVVAKKAPFEKGLLLDPWRHSGELYWTKLKDDPEYTWVENLERSRYFGTIQK